MYIQFWLPEPAVRPLCGCTYGIVVDIGEVYIISRGGETVETCTRIAHALHGCSSYQFVYIPERLYLDLLHTTTGNLLQLCRAGKRL